MIGIIMSKIEDNDEARIDHVVGEDEAAVLRELFRLNPVEDGQAQLGQGDVEEVADVDGERGHGLRVDVGKEKIFQKVAAFCH